MLLSNQKYFAVKYEFSSEFSDYLTSITSFIYKLISTYQDANLNENRFYHIDIPDGADKLTYYEDEDNSKSLAYIKDFVKEELNKQLKINKDVIFTFNDLILYSENKKSSLRQIEENECVVKTVYETTFNKISYTLNENNLLKNKILEFWRCKIDSLTYRILEKYIDEKISISTILVSYDNKYIDLFPINQVFFKEDKLIFDAENKVHLDQKIIDRFFEKTNICLEDNTINIDYVKYDDDNTIEEIGIYINEILYLFDFYKSISKLKVTQKLLFEYFNFSIKVDFQKEADSIFDFSTFRAKNKDAKLTTLLSELENNLYLKRVKHEDLDEEVKEFFKTSYLVQNKEFKNFHFFVSKEDSENEFLFGIFNNSNEQLHNGDRVKGLKCWIDKNSKEIKSFENYEHIKNAAQLVCHLSPEYAFYYKEKFFEDYLEDILKEIKDEETDLYLDYTTNNKFYFSKENKIDSPLEKKYQKEKIEQEFDFIVTIIKDGIEKNIVLEAKTKLSKFIADDQRHKVEKYIKRDELKIFDEYVLIGFNHDETMKSLQYFQNKYPLEKCSHIIDIAFKYPLPATEDKDLYCMSSNNYENLKASLIQLFKQEIYEEK